MVKVSFWLYEENWRLLRKATRRCGVARNRLVNLAVEYFLKSGVDERFGDVRLEMEAVGLMREANRLVRLQSAILKHGPYLKPYVDVLVRGGKLNKEYRQGLAEYPGGVKAVDALERIFGRRQAISRRLAEIAVELLPDERYEMPRRLGLHLEPSLVSDWPRFQHLVRWTEKGLEQTYMATDPCPHLVNWANKQYRGLPDRQYCSFKEKFVRQPACWKCWNSSMQRKVFSMFTEMGDVILESSRSPVTETTERR